MHEQHYFVTIEVLSKGMIETVQKAIHGHPFYYYFKVKKAYQGDKVDIALRDYREITEDEFNLWNELSNTKKEKSDG